VADHAFSLHPHLQQTELFNYCLAHNIVPVAYSPIGSPGRPERDRTPDDTVDVEDPVITAIAQRIGVQFCMSGFNIVHSVKNLPAIH